MIAILSHIDQVYLLVEHNILLREHCISHNIVLKSGHAIAHAGETLHLTCRQHAHGVTYCFNFHLSHIDQVNLFVEHNLIVHNVQRDRWIK